MEKKTSNNNNKKNKINAIHSFVLFYFTYIFWGTLSFFRGISLFFYFTNIIIHNYKQVFFLNGDSIFSAHDLSGNYIWLSIIVWQMFSFKFIFVSFGLNSLVKLSSAICIQIFAPSYISLSYDHMVERN